MPQELLDRPKDKLPPDDEAVEQKVMHITIEPGLSRTDTQICLPDDTDASTKQKIIEDARKKKGVFDSDIACGPG